MQRAQALGRHADTRRHGAQHQGGTAVFRFLGHCRQLPDATGVMQAALKEHSLAKVRITALEDSCHLDQKVHEVHEVHEVHVCSSESLSRRRLASTSLAAVRRRRTLSKKLDS